MAHWYCSMSLSTHCLLVRTTHYLPPCYSSALSENRRRPNILRNLGGPATTDYAALAPKPELVGKTRVTSVPWEQEGLYPRSGAGRPQYRQPRRRRVQASPPDEVDSRDHTPRQTKLSNCNRLHLDSLVARLTVFTSSSLFHRGQYLATLDAAAFGAASDVTPKFVSSSDPAAQWTGAMRGPAFFAYAGPPPR